MRALAVIAARGGSKRIPRKNIKEFCGQPIIHYSIKAALESGVFEEVMVSTDDAEIAEIAKAAGAQVPFMRSKENASDFATTAKVVEEVVTGYKQSGREFDAICCIYPTAPFVSAEKLKNAMNLLTEKEADSVLPVVRFSFPPQRSVVMEGGYMKFKWPEHALTRSQDLEPFYHDVGQFYFMNANSFDEQKKLVMEIMVRKRLSEMFTRKK